MVHPYAGSKQTLLFILAEAFIQSTVRHVTFSCDSFHENKELFCFFFLRDSGGDATVLGLGPQAEDRGSNPSRDYLPHVISSVAPSILSLQ